MTGWLTTILIFLPVAGALAVWLLPLPRQWVGSLAALVSLVEIGFWIAAVQRFDFSSSRLQLAQDRSWFRDLGVSYHVGEFGYSLWLVGLTVVCGAAACLYAWWAGRERPRAYFGLLLFLTGSVVGVFSAQDLLVFYAFFEAMLIPLYVLIGVWGGAARMRATITFVVYTVAGSIGEVTRSFRLGAGEVSRVQNGLVRSYALALASGVAVLAVVFLSTR
jgi:NADH-quinone oxidoreductase subunit M